MDSSVGSEIGKCSSCTSKYIYLNWIFNLFNVCTSVWPGGRLTYVHICVCVKLLARKFCRLTNQSLCRPKTLQWLLQYENVMCEIAMTNIFYMCGKFFICNCRFSLNYSLSMWFLLCGNIPKISPMLSGKAASYMLACVCICAGWSQVQSSVGGVVLHLISSFLFGR